MANIKSQMKRNRQNEQARLRNKTVRCGDSAAAEEALKIAQARIDAATSSGVLHANTAARRKSKLTKQVHTLLGS